uniref:Uncharacterized protein n=1 Tax=Parastrongyloides trichosuri TaxID=131310 RepID=A0A0N4ZBG1_PARTI
MSASTAIPISNVSSSSTVDVFQNESAMNLSRRYRDKRAPVHHYHPHVRATHRSCDKRKLREKRKSYINAAVISTDGTTSGDDGENAMIEIHNGRRDNLTSDLEADCEDNNSTDADALSQTGSFREKNPETLVDTKNITTKDCSKIKVPNNEESLKDSADNIQFLNEKIKNLELQLQSVLKHNVMLKEENEILKKRKHKS